MMNIKIVATGKLKETYWKESEGEYLKRLKPYAKIEIIEIREEPFREGDDREKIKEKEAKKQEKHLSRDAVVIALHERGKEMASPELSSFLTKHSTKGESIIFIIGGPLGLHESILKRATLRLSLSQLTFPHQMVRTILLEQLYRGVTIQKEKCIITNVHSKFEDQEFWIPDHAGYASLVGDDITHNLLVFSSFVL